MDIEMAARQLEALGNPARLRIYRALVRAGHAGLPVGHLQERIGMPASTLSHHVRRLIDTGLLRQQRCGTSLICHAEYAAMNGLLGFLSSECCADEEKGGPRCSGETKR
ncbi:MAG: metalloregulator ArsR/SmtB family transcription factor [Oricola sp.]